MAIIATAGAANANSFCTQAEADANAAQLGVAAADWNAASDTVKEAALRQATALLDAMFVWCGTAASTTQALGWPRSGLKAPNGGDLSSTTVPKLICDATAAYARHLLETDPTASAGGSAGGEIKSLKAGSVQIVYTEGTAAAATRVVPDPILWIIPKAWVCEERQPREVTGGRVAGRLVGTAQLVRG